MSNNDKKNISRRDFIKYSAMAGAAAAIPWRQALGQVAGTGPYGIGSPNLTKFKDFIRLVGTDIQVAESDGFRYWKNGKVFSNPPGNGYTTATHYTIDIGPYNQVLHSDFITSGSKAYIPGFQGTRLRGFGQGANFNHLGGVIVAQRNTPIQITFNNNLPPGLGTIPNDTTIPQPAGNRFDRVAIHLHGGLVPWISDGGPFDWWAPDGQAGTSFLNNQVLNPGAAPNQGEYYYPNDQSARLVWYHDHAWGITRTNAYSGIASAYVITDPASEGAFAAANPGVPDAGTLATLNSTVFYLVFQDKIFFPPSGPPANYPALAGPGDLFYADIYDTALFGPPGLPSFGQPLLTPMPFPSCVPEFFGDTILVNGAAYPTLEVEARPVRFRMLNACNARVLNPRLVATAGLTFPNNAEPKPNALGPGFIQIGTEGGYLPQAVPVGGKGMPLLVLGGAERADVLCDFSKVAVGTEFILYNDAPAPYPGGFGGFDYYPGNPKTPASIPGYGPNSRTLMKIRVKAATGQVTPLPAVINMTTPNLHEPFLINQTPGVPTPTPAVGATVNGGFTVANVRVLTLNEGFDEYGRLTQMLGTNTQLAGSVPGFFGRKYLDPVTENIAAGAVEVWQLINLTADTHPIHFHLVNVQILSRQAVKTKGFVGTITINPNAQPVAPDLNELGWKETVRMNPGEVITVIAKWDLPTGLPFTVPPSPRTGGSEYVFHCHILEHEEHDMMRPINVG